MITNKINSILKDAGSIAILPHVFADGDALGSSIALGLALKKLNKDIVIYLEEDIPYLYNFLPGKSLTEIYSGKIKKFDVVVALDTGDLDRLGKRLDVFNSIPVTVNIDHHQTNTEFAFYNHVNTGSAAVGEIIYQMIKTLGLDIDTDISTCLYVALTTDTGGFRFSNTTSVTHQIAGDLINNGISVAEISQQVFDSTSVEKVKLMGMAVNTLELFENNKVAIITLSDDIIKASGAKDEDCDGIVNIGRNIRGVEVAAVLRQRSNGEIKVNLRSNRYVDVASIANMYKGGGHKKAAGFTVEGNINDIKQKLLQDIKEVL